MSESIQQKPIHNTSTGAEGQAQFFTPHEFGEQLCQQLCPNRRWIADLNCGNGSLLNAASDLENRDKLRLYGIDIDPCHLKALPNVTPVDASRKITGDLTHLFPMLASVDWQTPTFVLNPPWDLHWYRDRLTALADSTVASVRHAFAAHDGRTQPGTIDATIATMMMALDRMPEEGEGLLIGNEATLQRLLLKSGAPHGALREHCWLHLVFEGNSMTGNKTTNFAEPTVNPDAARSADAKATFATGVVYFARDHTAGPQERQGFPVEDMRIQQDAWKLRDAKLNEWLKGTTAYEPSPVHEPTGIRCIAHPTMADLMSNAFKCVVIDEGVRLKGDHTLISLGVRALNPDYRLVLTATPIKNRLPDTFWLAQWATGGLATAHARWPYPGSMEAKRDFTSQFVVSERNVTKEERARQEGRKGKFKQLTVEVCNVHRLWKVMAPITLRRRKQDTGEPIVAKHRHVIRVPLGKLQAEVYRYHLEAQYQDNDGKPAPGAKLQALRVVAAAPQSELLQRRPRQSEEPLAYRSSRPFTPKTAAVLELIAQCLERGQQVVHFSALHSPNDYLEEMLQQAGIPFAKLDGRMSPPQRGRAAAEFKRGPEGGYPVLLAGVESMSEGHSFHLCPNAILSAYSWAYDKFEQAINRVHRMNSPLPVNVYSVICSGSVDRRLESSIAEKGDAAGLVLDGSLAAERVTEMSAAQLLNEAWLEFEGEQSHVCEEKLAEGWPALKGRLTAAFPALPV